ncbi:MAG: hypothetical protein RLZZ360_504 [Candidatus Parcubacteria bacterium]|jgi:hypothetical protein
MTYQHHPRFNPPSVKSVVQPLPRRRRRFLFLSLILLFVCAVPVFVFYATGYRYDIFAPHGAITATGGLYISVGVEEGEVYLNETRVEDSRIFRSAIYIQNIMPGLQRLHVQAPGYHTWVKELPVYPHIVTEASAFMLPLVPQVRPITEFITSTGSPVYLGVSSTTVLFPNASATVAIMATSSKATTTLTRNTEFTYVRGLFGTTTASTSAPFINRVVDEARDIFETNSNATTSSSSDTESATTTIIERDVTLFRRADDIVVRFTGSERNIPYYFCIPEDMVATTSERYEAQVIAARKALAEELELESGLETTTTAERECRREIMIDRQEQDVISFYFMPGTTDLVVLHRQDGVFVTEVDDRAWQNTQPLYKEGVDAVVVDGGRIFVKDGTNYFELLTELPTT